MPGVPGHAGFLTKYRGRERFRKDRVAIDTHWVRLSVRVSRSVVLVKLHIVPSQEGPAWRDLRMRGVVVRPSELQPGLGQRRTSGRCARPDLQFPIFRRSKCPPKLSGSFSLNLSRHTARRGRNPQSAPCALSPGWRAISFIAAIQFIPVIQPLGMVTAHKLLQAATGEIQATME